MENVVAEVKFEKNVFSAFRPFPIVMKLIRESKKMPWDEERCLIVADSTQEKRMGQKFKVRGVSGVAISDLSFHLPPLLQKKTDSVIIMAGTNDAIEKYSDCIVSELMQLRCYVETVLPSCKVILLCPPMRVDKEIA